MKFPVFSICPIKVEPLPDGPPAMPVPALPAGGRGLSAQARVDTSNGTFYALTDTKREENFFL
jgi:hypothetical protein